MWGGSESGGFNAVSNPCPPTQGVYGRRWSHNNPGIVFSKRGGGSDSGMSPTVRSPAMSPAMSPRPPTPGVFGRRALAESRMSLPQESQELFDLIMGRVFAQERMLWKQLEKHGEQIQHQERRMEAMEVKLERSIWQVAVANNGAGQGFCNSPMMQSWDRLPDTAVNGEHRADAHGAPSTAEPEKNEAELQKHDLEQTQQGVDLQAANTVLEVTPAKPSSNALPGEISEMIQKAVEEAVSTRIQDFAQRPRESEAKVHVEDSSVMGGRTGYTPTNLKSSEPHIMSARDIEDDARANCNHVLQETIWETAILFNVNGVSLQGSLLIVVGLLCNLVIQLTFLYVLDHSFLFLELPDVEDVWAWRELHGHHSNDMIMATRTSLVRAICNGDRTVITSSKQENTLNNVQNYIRPTRVGLPLGALLCTVVLYLWSLSIGQEYREISSFVLAVMHQPRGRSTLEKQSDGAVILTGCSIHRVIFLLALSACRFGIGMALLIYGSIWQVNTLSIKELILNACALIMVLDVDELTFACLLPFPLKTLVRELTPLQRFTHTGSGWHGIPIHSTIALLGSVGFVTIIIFVHLLPNIERMKEIRSATCSGHKDFVYGDSPLGLTAVTATFKTTGEIQPRSRERQAIHNLITTESYPPEFLYIERYEDFRNWRKEDMGSVVTFFTSQIMGTWCKDYPFGNDYSLPAIRTFFVNNFGAHVKSCADLVDHCTSKFILVRTVCPGTCGCNQPRSGLLKTGPNQGCPEACLTSRSYRSELAQIPCTDYNASQSGPLSGFTRFVNEWWSAWQSPLDAENLELIRDDMLSKGCSPLRSMSFYYRSRLCWATAHYGSIRPFCPVTCKCFKALPLPADCPTQCEGGDIYEQSGS